jgi:hypothetical protein
MKICSKCGEEKDIGCFAKQVKSVDGLFPWCEGCRRKYRKNRYNEDLQTSREYNNQKRANRIQWFQGLKSNTPCADCSQIYEPYCMDYDHVPGRGEKIKSVSRMVLEHVSKDVILEEIKKCDLVCLFCHNKRTQNRFIEVLGEERKYPPHVQRNISIINEFKNKPCVICGQQYDHYNMQIDHIDPATKLHDVCQLKSRKVEILMVELAKCQVLCALCHRRKSITEQQDDKYSVPRMSPPKRQGLFYDPITNTKECGLCHEILSGELFRPNKKTTSGLDTYCKECFNEYRRERRRNI